MGDVVKVNQYIPGQNVQNMGINVNRNRVADDKTSITVNFTTSPATVTIKAGSLLESNGNLYSVENDIVYQMSGATDNYLTFNDSLIGGATPFGFGSSTSQGTFDPAKQGFYSGLGNDIRTLKWFIEQDKETIDIDLDIKEGAGFDNFFTRGLNSYFIDSATGKLVINVNRPSSPTDSDSLLIKKPCTLLIDFSPDPTGSGTLQEYFFYNGSWVQSSPVTGAITDFRNEFRAFNPGLYRWRVTQNTGFVNLDVYIISVYGDTGIVSPQVYELNP